MKTITELLDKAMKAIKSRRRNKPVMRVLWFYLLFVVLLLFTWYGAWIYSFAGKGDPNLEALSKFIVIVLGATGFFSFIMSCLVDKNHNGIPDKFENETTKETTDEKSNRHI